MAIHAGNISGSSSSTGSFGSVHIADKVGIGTTSPSQKFVIKEDSSAVSVIAKMLNDVDKQLYFGVVRSGAGTAPNTSLIGSAESLRFLTGDTGTGTPANERMVIDSSGKIGIGTTSPANKLEVHGDFYATGSISGSSTSTGSFGMVGVNSPTPRVKLQVNDPGTAPTAAGSGDYGTGFNITRADGLIGMTMGFQSSGNSMYIQGRNFTNTDKQPLLFNPLGGNVGIGTTSPGQILHISSSGNIKSTIESAGSSAGVQIKSAGEDYNSSLEFLSAGSSNGQIYYDHHATAASQQMIFQVGDGAVNALRIYGDGTTTFINTMTIDSGGTSRITIDGNNTSGDDGNLQIYGHTSAASRAYLTINNGVSSGGQNWYVGALRGNNSFAIGRDNDFDTDTDFHIDSSGNATFEGTLTTSGDVALNYNNAQLSIGHGGETHWGTGFDVLEVGHSMVLFCETADGADRNAFIGNNLYYDASGFKRHYGDQSVHILFRAGYIAFNTDASGTAGEVFTPTERMRITEDGDTGIGTNNPDRLLHVHKASAGSVTAVSYTELVVEDDGGSGISILAPDANSGNIVMGFPSDNDSVQLRGYYNSGNPRLAIELAASEKFNFIGNQLSGSAISTGSFGSIHTAGNVGIGTTSPDGTLHLNETSGVTNMILEGTSDTRINFKVDETDVWATGVDDSLSDSFVFANSEVLSANPRMVIETGGNVGIGTTAPSSFLHISNSSTSTYALKAINTSTQSWGAYIKGGGDSGDPSLNVVDKNDNPLLYVRGDGNVGIGTSDPSNRMLKILQSSGDGSAEISTNDTSNAFLKFGTDSDGTERGGFVGIDYSDQVLRLNYGSGFDGTNNGLAIGASSATFAGHIYLDNNMALYSDNSAGTPQKLLRVSTGDDVTLGNTSLDDLKFDVGGKSSALTLAQSTGNATFAGDVIIKVGDANDATLYFNNTSTYKGFIRYNTGTNLFSVNTNGNTRFNIDGSGNSTFAGNVSMNATHASTRSSGLHLESTAGHNWYLHPDSNGNMGISYNGAAETLFDASGAVTFSGVVSTSKIFEATGQNISHGASRIKISQENSTTSEIRFWGADTSTAGSLRFLGSSSDGSVGGTRLTIDSSGNVGIGTTSPSSPLHVVGTGTTDGATTGLFTATGNSSGTAYGIQATSTGASTWDNRAIYSSATGATHGNFSFYGASGVLYNAGNVGIGTDAPVNPLHINNASSYVRFTSPTTGTTSGDGARIGMNGLQLMIHNYESSDIKFRTSGANPAMLIDSSGNVGIGTSNPDTLLHTYQTSHNILKIENDGSGDIAFRGEESGTAQFALFSDHSDSKLRLVNYRAEPIEFSTDRGGTENVAMTILDSGNVGIGTTAPSQTLTVAGNISASGDYYVQDQNAIVGESRLQISSSNSQIYTATEFSFNIKSSGNFSIISGSSIPFKVHDTTGEVVLGTQGFTNETGNKLTVYGDSHFSGSSMFSGSIVVGGDDDVHLDIIQGSNFGQNSTQTSALNVYKDSGNSTDGVAHFVNSEAVVNSDDFILRLEYDDERTVESTHDFIQFHNQDGEVGSINSEVAYSTFTGAHVSQRPSGSDFSNWKPGMVVNSTGNIVYTSSISNAWPEVELTTTQKDKAVMGVFAYTGSVKIISSLDNNLPSIHYNAIGEGKVLVTDTNGNIETGDYICSSTRTGHGEKQDEVYLANFTVAKATQPYNFTSASNDADLGYKSVLIACTYHCG